MFKLYFPIKSHYQNKEDVPTQEPLSPPYPPLICVENWNDNDATSQQLSLVYYKYFIIKDIQPSHSIKREPSKWLPSKWLPSRWLSGLSSSYTVSDCYHWGCRFQTPHMAGTFNSNINWLGFQFSCQKLVVLKFLSPPIKTDCHKKKNSTESVKHCIINQSNKKLHISHS